MVFTTEDTLGGRGRFYGAPEQSGKSSPLLNFLGYNSQGNETGWGKVLGWVPGLNIISNMAARSMTTGDQHDQIASQTKSRIFRTIAEAGIAATAGGAIGALGLGAAAGAAGATGGTSVGAGAASAGVAGTETAIGAAAPVATTAATGASGIASGAGQVGQYTKLLQQLYNNGGKQLINSALQPKQQQQGNNQQGQYLIVN